jgi:DNA-binding NarL/FixJ family response regulator
MDPLRVVLIDDAECVRDAVAASLRNAGHEIVGQAGDGAGGLRETVAHRPDVVIMDWRMPGMDGVEAARQIRAAHPSAAVIAFTSTDTPELRDAYRVAGAAAFVAKGDVRRLIAAVGAIAEHPGQTQAGRSSSP